MAANDITKIDRSYIDNYAIKEFVKDSLVPKYFTDDDISLRTVGLVGMMSEMVSNVAEDGFNATSVLFREIFPNRAEIPESIYSHAALFQLSDIFGSASSCRFIIVFDEKYIIKYSTFNQSSGIYSFTIPKDLTVYVENIPYCLDYDIIIKSVKKNTTTNKLEYVFSAMYDKTGFINSISDITDTYIKIQRDSKGYIGLDVTMRQVVRSIEYHNIINNNKINLPVIDIPFTGQLAGFDVLYKTPDESGFNTQLKTQVIYSQPTTTPFCFYQLYDDNTLRISFNARDAYFIPEYNSEIEVTLYISEGEKGNFDVYNGTNISITSETMTQLYSESILMGAKPLGSSLGGKDRTSIDELRALTVEGYRTALSLTTEPDLNYYFDDWKYRYGDSYIKFIKRRNDVYERIFGGFIVVRNNDYVYKTNTLNIKLNLSDMINPEENIYMIEPGTVFEYTDNETRDFITFRRDAILTENYRNKYNTAISAGTIPFLSNGFDPNEEPEHLNRPASFAEFKLRNGYDDKINVFTYNGLTDQQKLEIDNPIENKFTFINPFLIRFKRDPNLVSLYLTVLNRDHSVDFIRQNENSYVQFMIKSLNITRNFSNDKKFEITTKISPTVTLGIERIEESNHTVTYNNNLVAIEGEVNGAPKYILNRYSLDKNALRVIFVIYNNETPVCYSEMYPVEMGDNGVITFKTQIHTDDHITSDGRLRLVNHTTYGTPISFSTTSTSNNVVLTREAGSYYELPPILSENGYDLDEHTDAHGDTIFDIFNNRVYSNGEFITKTFSNNDKRREYLRDYVIKPMLGMTANDPLPSNIQINGNRYNASDNKISTSANVFTIEQYYINGIPGHTSNNNRVTLVKHDSLVNMTHNDFILIPKENVKCKIFTLYNKKYNDNNAVGQSSVNAPVLIPLEEEDTDNIFVEFDNTYEKYFWTNEYATLYDPLTFIKPLNNVRSNLYFEDCTEETEDSTPENRSYVHDINDVRIESVPVVKYNIAFDNDLMGYLTTTFMNQYEHIDTTIKNRLRNETIIDAKFYNTYGRSNNYYAAGDIVNDSVLLLDTLNISIFFDMWFVQGTDLENAINEVKMYIKNRIESINNEGSNALHISNLMREIETNYAYVDHIRFLKINNYDTNVQSLVLVFPTLDDMDKITRRKYVPELITCDLDDIHINGSYNI